MAEISFPWSALGLLKDPITKFLFYGAYAASHQHYLERVSHNSKDKLGRLFEFDLKLENKHFSNLEAPVSKLILRNISGQMLSKVEVLVEANAGNAKYQDFAILHNVDDIMQVVHLPRIPLKDLVIVEGNKILIPFSEVQVSIRVESKNIEDFDRTAISNLIHPTYTEHLNSTWHKMWGFFWNLDHIVSKKHDLKDAIQYNLIGQTYWPVFDEPISAKEQIRDTVKFTIGTPLSWVLTRNFSIWILFWFPIFLGLRRL